MARVVEFFDQALVLLERGHVAFPVDADELRHRPAIRRIMDCRREHVLHWQLAELVVHREPRVYGARHGDRQ